MKHHSPAAQPTPAGRVSTLELFFDLVFVFTITQLTGLLAADITLLVLARVMLMLALIFWMYGGYAWLTNAVAPNSSFRRTLVLVGMGGFLAISLAIPDAFGATGWLFGLGYFVVNAVHTGLFLAAGGPGAARAMSRLGPINFGIATVVLVGGITPLPWRYGLWGLALVALLAAPYLNPISEFTISPAHFVERHGLLIIIALGESIVAIGAGVAGVAIDLRVVVVAILGLSVSYLLWWVYFGGDDTEAEHALARVPSQRRARVAIHAYGWAHYPLLLGIVATAAGVKKAVGHPAGHVSLAQAVALAGGITVYLIGDVWFRRTLRIGRLRYRLGGALVVLVTIPLGLWLVGVQLVAILVMLAGMLYLEDRSAGRSWTDWHRTTTRSAVGTDEVEQPST